MSVSRPFIERPIATSLLALATILGGILGYFALPISSLPQVDFPTVEVTTELPGASPETMSTLVTASLERQFGQIQSLASMSSTSSFGLSRITLQFNLDRDIDAAAQDVQAAINAAGSTLPRNLPYPPTYSKVNPADTAIVTLALTSDTQSLRSLSDLADTLLAQRLSSVSGVGHVSIEGGIKPAVRIEADVSRLASYGLSMADLSAAISAANVAGPKGSLDGDKQSYTIAANDQISRSEVLRRRHRRLSQQRTCASEGRRDGQRRTREHACRRLVQWQSRRHRRRSKTARRQRHRHGRPHKIRVASRRAQHAGRRQSANRQRPHRNDPRLRPRRAIHARPERRPRRHGRAALPALASAPRSSPASRCRFRSSPRSASCTSAASASTTCR